MKFLFLIFFTSTSHALDQSLDIVTSNSILASIAGDLVSDKANIKSLVVPGQDPHLTELKPGDLIALEKADLILINGEGLESWELKLPKRLKEKIFIATSDLNLLEIKAGKLKDPHFWHDPRLTAKVAKKLSKRLESLDPKLKPVLKDRTLAVEKEYLELFNECEKHLKDVKNRKAVISHDAFMYFSKAFNIDFLAANGWSTHHEPRPRDVVRLRDQIIKEKVAAIFVENGVSSPILKKLATETGIKIGGSLYGDMLTEAAGEAPTYAKMIRHNCDVIAKGLK